MGVFLWISEVPSASPPRRRKKSLSILTARMSKAEGGLVVSRFSCDVLRSSFIRLQFRSHSLFRFAMFLIIPLQPLCPMQLVVLTNPGIGQNNQTITISDPALSKDERSERVPTGNAAFYTSECAS
jgi:hypothetical protein